MKPILIPIEISARHVHLTAEDWKTLFSTPHPTVSKLISQRPQFVATERVELLGPKGGIKNIGVVGPVRPYSQVELSRTDARTLGIDAPLGSSGELKGAAEITIRGPKGQITIRGAMVQQRHIHASPEEADRAGLRHGDSVRVRILGARGGELDHVLVRIHPTFTWHLHLDTDEANAMGVGVGSEAQVIVRA